jgi:biopolymer transport protein ExbB
MAFLEISTILQAQTQVAATTGIFFLENNVHGNIFANVVMITVLLLGIFSFYLFLEKILLY